MQKNWHSVSAAQAAKELNSDIKNGLHSAEARRRLERNGYNVLHEEKGKGIIRQFLEQFKDFMVLVLLAAAVVSFATAAVEGTGDFLDPIIILTIVVLNAIIGVVQERKAERSLQALKKLSAPHATVIRDKKHLRIASEEIAEGDIVLLSAGDFVPADARIVSSSDLRVQESSLTGESLPISKDAGLILPADSAPADRKNMLFASTTIVGGHCTAVITQTGMNTQVGTIAGMLNEEVVPETPLQIRLAKVGKMLGLAALAICGVIFILGLLQKSSIMSSFMLSVSLAVAAIPEGLPAIVTVVLSAGVSRMAKNNAIIRRLPAVETLGAASVICSDKTGTLTKNIMTVTELYGTERELSFKSKEAKELLEIACLCNNSRFVMTGRKKEIQGEPTENALLEAGERFGLTPENLNKEMPRLSENAFSSERKMMSTLHKRGLGYRLAVKGAPDVLLQKCTKIKLSSGVVGLSPGRRRAILAQNEKLASNALRVIAVAFRDVYSSLDNAESELVFCGLIGMQDPPRKEAFEAVKMCKNAGITPVMITGDHAMTAMAIAKQLGIAGESDTVITGNELAKMSEEQLAQKINSCRVFARVTPEHKVRIVKAYRSRGDVVAMTGDGVNDSPALKAADIGCAMGKNGTEVAKAAADMILTDDNFATIVKAVEQGRGIYDNIKKAVHFLLSCNIGEIICILFASIMGFPSPLLPIQLLWVNLVTDSLPAMALGAEKLEKDAMNRPPVKANKSFFADGLWFDIVIEGIMVGSLSLAAFVVGRFVFGGGVELGRTMAFGALSLCELVHALNMRTTHSIFSIGPFSNKKMTLAIVICTLLQVAAMTVEPLCKIFKTVPLNLEQWLFVAAISFVPLVVVELGKILSGSERKQKNQNKQKQRKTVKIK